MSAPLSPPARQRRKETRPQELLDARDRHRSPLVWQVVADHLAGHRSPLTLLQHLA